MNKYKTILKLPKQRKNANAAMWIQPKIEEYKNALIRQQKWHWSELLLCSFGQTGLFVCSQNMWNKLFDTL